jgi:hypothetical protein
MAMTETPPVEEKPSASSTVKKQPPRRGNFFFGIVALVIVLALLGLGIWAAQSASDNAPAPNASPTPNPTLASTTVIPVQARTAPQISELLADPAEYQTLFAATANGIKRSGDGGQTWTDLDSADIKGQTITALAIDGEDAERPLYAGTFNNGVFKSSDGGKTWTNLGLKERSIVALAAYKSAVYVAVNGPFAGVYHSTDAGKTFLPADKGNLPANIDIRSIAINPDNPLDVYIGTAYVEGGRAPDYSRVRVSHDGGRTWNSLGRWELNQQPDPRSTITVLLYAPGDRVYAGDGNRLYRLSADRNLWQSAGTGLPEGVYAVSSDPQLPGIVYAAAPDGFYRNTGTQDWQKLDAGKGGKLLGADSAVPNLIAVNTHSNAVSVNGLNSTYLYGLTGDGQLLGFENRDFGKGVVAAVPGFKEPDFSPYNGVNPAAAVDPPAPDTPPDPGKTYFPETKHYLSGGFKTFWDKNGGLAAFGYPLTEEFSEFIQTQNVTKTVQYFERVRLEYDPKAKAGQEVSVGLLGRDAVALKYYVPGRFLPNTRDQAYFPETKHTLRLGFYQFWSSNGGLGRFGYPLSEEVDEKNVIDGKPGTVQYFERVKLEFDKDTKQVKIGNLGREILIRRGWLRP